MNPKATSVLPPIVLLEWGGVLLYFHLSGRINAFLHPSFRLNVLLAGIVLSLCALTLLVTRKQSAMCECGPAGNCGDRRAPLVSSWLFPLMLLLPLGIAASFTRDSFGANFLATRGVADHASAIPGLAEKFKKNLPSLAQTAPAAQIIEPGLPEANPSAPTGNNPPAVEDVNAENFFKPDASGNIKVNVGDLLYAAQEPSLSATFVNKSAEVVGQFMPAKTNNPDGSRFKLVRLFMTCCAADAQPVSLLVERAADLPIPAGVSEMGWTKVVGDITFPLENGRATAIIRARKIEPVSPPEETMLY